MRTWLHLALWGALFLGACSSGGPGGLISFQNVREAPTNSLDSPGPGGGESVEVETPSGSTGTPNNGGRDGGGNVPDVNIPDVNVERPDVSVGSDASASEAGGNFTCEDLQACCDSLTGAEQTQCQQARDSTTSDSVCSSYLTAIKNNGRCTG
jgi:hypothetical protein